MVAFGNRFDRGAIRGTLMLVISCAALSLSNGATCDTPPSGPVCSFNGTTYASACDARAAGALIAYPGSCTASCSTACPNQAWRPVCIQHNGSTSSTYGSPCFATCNNRTNFGSKDIGIACKTKQGCACTKIYMPVCGADNKTYGNAGCAECAEVPVQYQGKCNTTQKDCTDTCGASEAILDKTCIVKKSGAKSYRNPCLAQCQGGTADGAAPNYYYKEAGGCDAKCDAQCRPWYRNGTFRSSKYTKRVCCGGQEFPSACYAECLGKKYKYNVSTCTKGQCTGDAALGMLRDACPKGSVAAMCLVDPCQTTRCTAKGATCVSIYCTKFFRLEYIRGVCEAVWLDPKKGNLVQPTCPP